QRANALVSPSSNRVPSGVVCAADRVPRMTISATVSLLAKILGEQVGVMRPSDQQLRLFLNEVARMSEYCRESRLDEWERSVQTVELDPSSKTQPLVLAAE